MQKKMSLRITLIASLGNCANSKPFIMNSNGTLRLALLIRASSGAGEDHSFEIRGANGGGSFWKEIQLLLQEGRKIDAGQPVTGIPHRYFQGLFPVYSFKIKFKTLTQNYTYFLHVT